MDLLKKHETFEIELLEKLKNKGLLNNLVFGGGTMLRLCYELNRYSADLDFWFTKKINYNLYFQKIKAFLTGEYKLTDAQNKYYTVLLEISSPAHPRKLKIEIRKKIIPNGREEKIAFSKYSNTQVFLKCFSLDEMLKNKISALLGRREIRDAYDLEFIVRRGIPLKTTRAKLEKIKTVLSQFKPRDFGVILGSVLEEPERQYYRRNGFEFLLKKIDSLL